MNFTLDDWALIIHGVFFPLDNVSLEDAPTADARSLHALLYSAAGIAIFLLVPLLLHVCESKLRRPHGEDAAHREQEA
jgi:hypothetical protein